MPIDNFKKLYFGDLITVLIGINLFKISILFKIIIMEALIYPGSTKKYYTCEELNSEGYHPIQPNVTFRLFVKSQAFEDICL